MDSPAHHCSYTWYTGCKHKVINCHPERPLAGRISDPVVGLACPACREAELAREIARFAPAVG